MLLKEITGPEPFTGLTPEELELDISAVCCDSRNVRDGALFVALKGEKEDGAQFIEDALRRGARVVVAGPLPSGMRNIQGRRIISVDNPQEFLAKALLKFYRDPSKRVNTIGITGTNGKTTITYLIEAIMRRCSKSCGVIGTVNYRYLGKSYTAKNTTPGIADNYMHLSRMAEGGVDYCLMEVSSHALVQKRVEGIDIRTAVFTNLTSDHLDYHRDREDYFMAKSLLFKRLSSDALAVINTDDPYGSKLCGMTKARVRTYGIQKKADVMATDINSTLEGLRFTLNCEGESAMINTRLIGTHNIYNILASALVCIGENVPLGVISRALEEDINIPGRMERVDCGQDFYCFTDYAHTEDAIKNILNSLRSISAGKIILVFGCGGDRDKGKRPEMGKAACELADVNFITNDNPRTEDPLDIIGQIKKGFYKDNYTVVADRKEAISRALKCAGKGDVVIIAGKGHEDYQVFKDKTVSFEERKIVRELITQGLA